MSVSYSRINWTAYPSTTTAITAERLNVMDKGIYDCANAINDINATNVLTDAAISGSGSTVTTSISKGTALEDIVGTLVNNDYALNADLTTLSGKVPKYKQLTLSAQSIASGSTATITGTGSYDWLEVLYYAYDGDRCCTKVPASANVNIPLIKSTTEIGKFSISAPSEGVRTITNNSGITLVVSAVFGITI